MRHKHYDVIVAWAEGKEIQVKHEGRWTNWDYAIPPYHNEYEYRIKPEPKPDVVREGMVSLSGIAYWGFPNPNLRLTFDGETGKLKQAEVIE